MQDQDRDSGSALSGPRPEAARASAAGTSPGGRLRRPKPPAAWMDIALATVAMLAVFPEWDARQHEHPTAWLGLAAALVASAALFWRVRLGERLLLIAIACGFASAVFGGPDPGIVDLAALYTIGTIRSWRFTVGAAALAVAAGGLNEAIRAGFHGNVLLGLASLFGVAAVMLVPAALGLYMGARRAYVRSLIERAEDLERERELLERERELLAREAVSVERARIARELHDVVAHHVSVMVIQAGAAESQLPPEAAASRQAIGAIRETGREALTEMRRLLGLLRDEARATGHGTETSGSPDALEPRTPQPGLADLPVLIARMREAGVNAKLEYAGAELRVSPAIDLSAYRIAQEALTNTLRHAGPGANARLRLTFEPGRLVLEATDDGPLHSGGQRVERPAEGRAGHGLVGMRERVALFDGTFEAGPRRGGGFRVAAAFPLEPSDEAARAGVVARTISPDESAAGPLSPGTSRGTGESEADGPATAGAAPVAREAPDARRSFDRSNPTEGEA